MEAMGSFLPSGAKAHHFIGAFAAQLKSCPDIRRLIQVRSPHPSAKIAEGWGGRLTWKSVPHSSRPYRDEWVAKSCSPLRFDFNNSSKAVRVVVEDAPWVVAGK